MTQSGITQAKAPGHVASLPTDDKGGRSRVGFSWIDDVLHGLSGRRMPARRILLFTWAFGAVVVAVGLWAVGVEPAEIRYQVISTFYWAVGVGGYFYLSNSSARSLERFSPALDVMPEEFETIRLRLTTLTPRAGVVATVTGVGLTVGAGVSDPALLALFDRSLVAGVIGALNLLLGVGSAVVMIFLLVRTLKAISGLHRRADAVDIFRPGPAHAFAGTTARAGGILIVAVSYSVATDPSTFINPVWIGFTIVSFVLAVLAFVLPLSGMHRQLKEHKENLLARNQQRMGAVVEEFHTKAEGGRYAEIDTIKKVLDALEWENGRIRRASTWPWETATLRGFATTLLLPVLTWLSTTYLGRLLNP